MDHSAIDAFSAATPCGVHRFWLAGALALLQTTSLASPDAAPCAAAVREWAFSGRDPARFEVPDGLTRAQCDAAWASHDDLMQKTATANAEAARQAETERLRKASEAKALAEASAAARLRVLAAEEALLNRRIETERAAAARRAKLPGARLGMTMTQVRDQTNWGPPESMRRTLTTSGATEMWFYGAGQHLYFVNGRLASITSTE